MTDQEIYKKIEETYSTEKGKNFITHLLRSFLPISRSSRLMSNEKSLRLRDCITGEQLCTVDEHFNVIASEEGLKAFMDNAKAQIKQGLVEGATTYEIPESVKELKKKIKPIAITCEKSDKVISEQTLSQLFNFYASELLKGNKHVQWVINNERGKEFVQHGKKNGFIQNKKEERVVKKAAEHAKLSLGDFEVLQNLKKKLDSKG